METETVVVEMKVGARDGGGGRSRWWRWWWI
jgi:hypothetical protein